MLIEKLELNNFMCYSGRNTFNFTEGLNVIIGDNAYGKSKLYDAFYWVLYDKVFVSERKEFVDTAILRSQIVSDKAKHAAKDGPIETTVSITFNDRERDQVYILTRTLAVKKAGGVVVDDPGVRSELSILSKELGTAGRYVDDQSLKDMIIRKILPDDLKRYLWFQGEQVESIIDFNDQGALTHAINVLSSMSYYDSVLTLASNLSENVDKEYDRRVRAQSSDQVKFNALDKTINEAKKRRSELVLSRKMEEDKLSVAQSKCERLQGSVTDARVLSGYQSEQTKCEENLLKAEAQLHKESKEFLRGLFSRKWILFGTNALGEAFANEYQRYSESRLRKIENQRAHNELAAAAFQTRLPLNVPEPIYVQQMLKDEICLVCNRPAPRGSSAYESIKALLGQNQLQSEIKDLESSLFMHNFGQEYLSLYRNYLALSSGIDSIQDEFTQSISIRADYRRTIAKYKAEIVEYKSKIVALVGVSSKSKSGPEDIINEYATMRDVVESSKAKIARLTSSIAECDSQIQKVNSQLENLGAGKIPQYIVDKKTLLNDFLKIASSTQVRIFNGLVNKLEDEANVHYTTMTSGNRATRGKIKLKKLPNGNFMPDVVNDDGVSMGGYNTGNLILIKLATIMAIISASSRSGAVNYYTLITDAPFSVFGEDYTLGFCRAVSNIYRQSIVMSKEFYRNLSLRKQLLAAAADDDVRLGSVYLIEPSSLEAERDNRNNLSTNIKKLN